MITVSWSRRLSSNTHLSPFGPETVKKPVRGLDLGPDLGGDLSCAACLSACLGSVQAGKTCVMFMTFPSGRPASPIVRGLALRVIGGRTPRLERDPGRLSNHQPFTGKPDERRGH